VTEQKRASDAASFLAARERFQLGLEDRIRPLTDPDEVTAAACEHLGSQLDAGRVLYGEVDDSGEFMDMSRDWTSGKLSSMAGKRLTLMEFGAPIIDAVRAGRVIAVDDVTTDARCAAYAESYLANGVRSVLAIPLMKQGRLKATLNAHCSEIHQWTDLEIAMADDIVDRTWSAVERARAQSKLRVERDRSQAIFDTMTEGFVMIDRNWTVLYLNAEGFRLNDRVGRQVIGHNHWEMWPEYTGTEIEKLYRRVMETRSAEIMEFHNTCPDGRALWLEIRVYHAMDGGIALFCRDVTSRKEAEEKLRDADRRKDEFLAMLAHELRNPLAPIGAAAELLQRVKLDEDRIRTTSAVIGRQVSHMTGLIDDLLDVSRVTRGLIEMNKDALDIQHVVNEAVEQVSPLIRSREHELTMRLAPQAAMVEGDKKRLVQVLANILNNAAKYTAEGGHLALRTSVQENHVLIEVTDDGIGMTPEMAKHAFDLFAQAERSSDRSSGGLGLGLALVKSLVELHGGTVACKSGGLGQGSTFSICLPRLAVQAQPVARAAGKRVEATTPAGPLRILVVDDNVDAAEMLKLLLEAAGHEVVVEHGPFSALERAKRYKPQVCLVDIGLPEIDGNEVARRLRAQSENSSVVLVAITGYGQESDRASALAAGFNHHLVKPVDTNALSSILSAIAET
jgi:PAS domain S-box-containing protein